jgi:hypothetical protein
MSVIGATDLLLRGGIDVEGRLIDASNATLYCTATLDDVSAVCVYKPVSGERPLWDFPTGTLAARERATYLVSEAAGWHLVPTTVLRDGPFGPGMVQLWIDVDEQVDPVALVRSRHPDLRRMAVLDAVVNNADRKGGHVLHGHVLPDDEPSTYGVDHGVTFSEDEKLRTVLWGWAGERLDDELVDDLERLADALEGSLGDTLGLLLTRREVARTKQRVGRRLREAAFPLPGDGWPSLPWPAF